MDRYKDKFCPITKDNCRNDCRFHASEESGGCVIWAIFHQLDGIETYLSSIHEHLGLAAKSPKSNDPK